MFGKPPFTSPASSAFGGFGAQTSQQNTSLFGQKSLFGTSGQSTNLFGGGQPTSTASTFFGQSKPLFGASNSTQQSGFGTTSLFGTTQPTARFGGLFGSNFGSTLPTGTTIKFDPPTGSDTMLRNGTNLTINTKHMCLTAMKQYESKSLEELRCEDYLANRKGPQGRSLTFGQPSQSSTSGGLFGSSTASTQPLLFGQNKPLFGSSASGYGSTAPTSSIFGTSTTSNSLFGTKPATGVLFGTSTSTSFGQTQTNTGLFGNKPATSGFGTQPNTLFGSSTFGTTTTAASPFTFGSSTAAAAPFGQTQPSFSSFGGFQQPASSTAAGGLFGAKPSTSGFGTTAGAQQTSGSFFGSKPSTGGLFGSSAGNSLFGQPASSSSISLFGSNAAKPTYSLCGPSTTQPVFGPSQQAAVGQVPGMAPIVLGANVNQAIIENAMIDAQLNASPYGDNPLLKIITPETMQKSDLPNPTSVERQMKFLASIKTTGAVTTTTPSGSRTMGSIPAAGAKFTSGPAALSIGKRLNNFSYRSLFSPPALRNSNRNHLLNIDGLENALRRSREKPLDSREVVNSPVTPETKLQFRKTKSSTKRLDLSILHKAAQEKQSVTSVSHLDSSTVTETVGIRTQSELDATDASCQTSDNGVESDVSFTRVSPQKRTPIFPKSKTNERNLEADSGDMQVARRERLPSRHHEDESNGVSENESELSQTNRSHPTCGIILTRRDYICEPTIEELMADAEDTGTFLIKNGLTIRRLGYGSVFWPGCFVLSSINLDEVVHFRCLEVIIYPDDSKKPPIGKELNRFAEISLERVWPCDKESNEFITDPYLLEEMNFRFKLERASIRMGATFKDYQPETGTWVFTVPHFTKYGYTVDELADEDLFASKVDSKRQYAVQLAEIPLPLAAENAKENTAPLGKKIDNAAFASELKDEKRLDGMSSSERRPRVHLGH